MSSMLVLDVCDYCSPCLVVCVNYVVLVVYVNYVVLFFMSTAGVLLVYVNYVVVFSMSTMLSL